MLALMIEMSESGLDSIRKCLLKVRSKKHKK